MSVPVLRLQFSRYLTIVPGDPTMTDSNIASAPEKLVAWYEEQANQGHHRHAGQSFDDGVYPMPSDSHDHHVIVIGMPPDRYPRLLSHLATVMAANKLDANMIVVLIGEVRIGFIGSREDAIKVYDDAVQAIDR